MVSLKMIRVKVVGVAVLETGLQLQFLCFNQDRFLKKYDFELLTL